MRGVGGSRAWCTTHSASDATSLAMLTPPPRDSASLLVVDSCTVNPLASPAAKALPSRENATLCTTAGPPSPTLLRDAVRDGLRASAMMPLQSPPPDGSFPQGHVAFVVRLQQCVSITASKLTPWMTTPTQRSYSQWLASLNTAKARLMSLGQGPAEGQRVCAVGRVSSYEQCF